MRRIGVGLLAVFLAGCATMPRFGDGIIVPCLKRPADYRWWDWPLAVIGSPVVTAIWWTQGSDERAMCPPEDRSGTDNTAGDGSDSRVDY